MADFHLYSKKRRLIAKLLPSFGKSGWLYLMAMLAFWPEARKRQFLRTRSTNLTKISPEQLLRLQVVMHLIIIKPPYDNQEVLRFTSVLFLRGNDLQNIITYQKRTWIARV